MRLRAGVVSDCGLVRSANEDSFLLRPGLYAVSDGMGGARAGEVASQMACFGLMGVDPATASADELRRVIVSINKAIVGRSAAEDHLLGMGTTLTVALIRDGTVTIAHVGDSRAYLLRDGDLIQITDDHSWVGEMVRRGDLTPAQAAIHPHRSVITRALGTDDDVVPDVTEMAITSGDRLLLCSDGLTGMITDTAIAELMQGGNDPQATAESLVQAALAAGGEDNVTVIVVDVRSEVISDSGEDETLSWDDDRIIIGPSDRGAAVSAASHRARRAGAAVRGRLGRLTVPSLRPVSAHGAGRGTGAEIEGPQTGLRGTPSAHDDSGARSADGGPPADGAPPADTIPPGAESLSSSEQAPAGGEGAAGDEALAGGEGPAGEADPSAGATAQSAPATAEAAASMAAQAPKSRRARRRWIFWLLVIVLVLAIACAGLAWFNSTVYYVGTTDDGKVALFHGLPASVFGLDFSSVIEHGTVDYVSLSPYMQERIDAHDLVGKEEGQRFLRSLSAEQ